jgi:hypothetical protein
MAEDKHAATASRSGSAPRMVAPTTRVNFAFPFSKITVEEPARDIAELASIVAELAAAVERAVTDPAVTHARERAEALADRLRLY